jgi:hypothetical protein
MSIRPRNGNMFSTGCMLSGKSGRGMMLPESTVATVAVRRDRPSPANVHISEMVISALMAALSKKAASTESTNAPAAARLGGRRSPKKSAARP